MQYKKLLMVAVLGLVVAFLTFITFVIKGEVLSMKLFYMSMYTGIATSLVYSYVITLLNKVAIRQLQNITIDLHNSEAIILDGAAQCCLKQERKWGKLYLTNSRVLFKSINSNVHDVVFSVDLKRISTIRVKKMNGLFGRSICLTTPDEEKNFLIDYPYDWRNIIEDQVLAIKDRTIDTSLENSNESRVWKV